MQPHNIGFNFNYKIIYYLLYMCCAVQTASRRVNIQILKISIYCIRLLYIFAVQKILPPSPHKLKILFNVACFAWSRARSLCKTTVAYFLFFYYYISNRRIAVKYGRFCLRTQIVHLWQNTYIYSYRYEYIMCEEFVMSDILFPRILNMHLIIKMGKKFQEFRYIWAGGRRRRHFKTDVWQYAHYKSYI